MENEISNKTIICQLFEDIKQLLDELGWHWVTSVEMSSSYKDVIIQGNYIQEIKQQLLDKGFVYSKELGKRNTYCYLRDDIMIFLNS
jgi:translation initiation factor 1 (eIF-1/SUI1)